MAPSGETVFEIIAPTRWHWLRLQGNLLLLHNAAIAMPRIHTRLWLRQNRQDIFAADSQTASLTSTAIASTQFLRCTGISTNGYFDGRIFEFLLYDGVLDDATTFAIEDWLAARYAHRLRHAAPAGPLPEVPEPVLAAS